ncbi:MAG: NAD-dependent epimerase/dehydratase family protein [Polyangiaceae bacterium]
MRFALVGGTRFIGHAATTEALRRGHSAVLLHRGVHPSAVAGAREVVVDRGDPSALARAIADAKPDVIIDTRAMTQSDAETTALALKVTRVPVVVLSSQDVYAEWGALLGYEAPPPEPLIRETSPLMSVRFPYRGKGHDAGEDYDKKDVEAVFRDAAVRGEIAGACVLRLPAVYGRRDYRRRFGAILDALDAGDDIPCAGGASFRWTHAHVRDVGHAIVLAAEKAKTGFRVYNVGEVETPTMHARVDEIARAAERTARWRETPEPLADAFEELGRVPRDLVVSSELIRAELGFAEVTTAEERLGDLVAWTRETRETKETTAARS